jgi:hypothetical protein
MYSASGMYLETSNIHDGIRVKVIKFSDKREDCRTSAQPLRRNKYLPHIRRRRYVAPSRIEYPFIEYNSRSDYFGVCLKIAAGPCQQVSRIFLFVPTTSIARNSVPGSAQQNGKLLFSFKSPRIPKFQLGFSARHHAIEVNFDTEVLGTKVHLPR